MSLRLIVASLALAGTVGLLGLASSDIASAHERRVVGNYELEVGFLVEPAIANSLNGVFMNVVYYANGVPETEGGEGEEAAGGEPVLGLDQTMTVTVIVGGAAATKELDFEPLEEPGSYVASFIPTLPGDYIFQIVGEIDGTEIDETFESGPNTFEPVEDPAELEFPPQADADGDTGSTEDAEDDDDGSAALIVAILALVLAAAAMVVGLYAANRNRAG